MAPHPHRAITKDISAFALVATIFGFSFGVTAQLHGTAWAQATVFSAVTFAGASQFATISILGTGGGAAAVIVTSLLLNARFLPLSLATASKVRVRGWRRLSASVVMTDPSALFALRAPDPATSRNWFWWAGISTWCGWVSGTLLGSLAADHLRFNPKTFGLDVALPALLIGVSASAFKDRSMLSYLAVGATGAVVLTPYVPNGVEFVLIGALA